MVQTEPLHPTVPAPPEGMAGASAPLVDAFVLHALMLLCWVAWLIPWPVWHLAASTVGFVGMGLRWRRVVLANVRHARAGAVPPLPVAWYLGAQQIATHCKAVVETLRAGVRRPDAANRLRVEGWDHLATHLGRRGIVVVAPHAGPYPTLGLMADQWLRPHGFTGEIVVVARLFRPFRSGALMGWFRETFDRAGATIVPVDEPPRRLAAKLRRVLDGNGIVVLLVDEPTRTPSAAVPFFDAAIRLPLGPARLAQATGSVVVPIVATYGRARRVTVTVAEPIEPVGEPTDVLARIAAALQGLVGRHLDQWAMLTPIWVDAPPPPGHAYADLHLHTPGSDGLCAVDEWAEAARSAGVSVIAVTDHDHLETIRAWRAGPGVDRRDVLPGVELTARGRIVHLGVLFPGAVPEELPPPGTPLVELVRWARTIPGSLVVLVHPLPLLWRGQLRRLARAGALPDAIETRFPLAGRRSQALERAAAAYGLAVLGGSDAHLAPGELGRHATLFPGETADDLVAAIRARTTRAATRVGGAGVRPPASVYALQCLYSWLLPARDRPAVAATRAALLRLARERRDAAAGAAPPAPRPAPR